MNDLRRNALSALALVAFGVLALGSGKSDNTPSSTAAPGASAAAATGAVGAVGPVLGTCTIKFSGKLSECYEHYGTLPATAADKCKSNEGVYQAGATPCPAEAQTGNCAEAGEVHYSYPNAIGDPKGSCELLGKKWTPGPAAKK